MARTPLSAAERHAIDHAHGLLSFDELDAFQPRRLHVLWIENKLDCRIWGYYCDIRDAMARLHTLCTSLQSCRGGRDGKKGTHAGADFAVIGPRYSINVMTDDDSVGFNRSALDRLPLFVIQNKMYVPQGWREIVGDVSAKLSWVRAAGASGAFTWLTKHHEFTRRSGVPHHWFPFGVNVEKFSRFRGKFTQSFDVGFTGASGADKYPSREAVLRELKMMNINLYSGTWSQTSLNRADNRSWQAGTHDEYVRRLADSKMWVSTTGPDLLVGTRYFEVMASGTTLLLCNRPNSSLSGSHQVSGSRWVYDGLFEENEHVAMFGSLSELRAKVNYFLQNEEERRRIVRNALALVESRHSWDARARFITILAERAIREAANLSSPPLYRAPPLTVKPPGEQPHYVGCFQTVGSKSFVPKRARYSSTQLFQDPPKSRNGRRLRRYTVQLCQESCSGRDFTLQSGGFSSGNGHTGGVCKCVTKTSGEVQQSLRRRPGSECATTCSLHDSRPCGGSVAIALFAYDG
ncbi:hypothetical protein AB1Y20_013108 [Prymnesium parvum]|uniref:Spore protein YkvP/CgeB glycosyl transferase-like domain-containing protein n=1 Tax=Prymnesium parvum TaxID=97485 RepID=A0AB34IM74_PRYPA